MVQMDTTDWYELSVRMHTHINCENDYNMVLYDSDLCSRCVEKSHALCKVPHVWTIFVGDTNAVDRFELQEIHRLFVSHA